MKNQTLICGDCLTVLPTLEAESVDLILTDLPYGTTGNKWDSIIPLDALWREWRRVSKPRAVVVLTATQPFTSVLVMSNLKQFKYDWTWCKEKGTGHLNAKRQPLRDKEDVLVFHDGQSKYNPQWGRGVPYNGNKRIGSLQQTSSYGVYGKSREDSDGRRYPRQVLQFHGVGRGGIHPTQKPVALFEYLIKTYTDEGDVVLDCTSGVGTTAIAALRSRRRSVCIEQDQDYHQEAMKRLHSEYQEFTAEIGEPQGLPLPKVEFSSTK